MLNMLMQNTTSMLIIGMLISNLLIVRIGPCTKVLPFFPSAEQSTFERLRDCFCNPGSLEIRVSTYISATP